MGENAYRVPIEELLTHAEWLAGVARRLVADAAAADDVVQQTWLRAIEKPPRRGGSARGWLRRVLGNEVRQRGRSERARSWRETQVGLDRPTSASASTPVLERAKLHREIVNHVLALDEPYRETLLLRFFEGLEPTAIARRDGLAAGTVRSRLKRGLDRLRDRLDAEHGGDRRAWALALIPLASGKGAAAKTGLAGGLLIMSTKAKLVAGVLCLVLLVGVTVVLTRGGESPSTPPAAPGATGEGDVAKAPDEPSGTEKVPAAEADAAANAPSEASAAAVRLAFVDESGKPLAVAEARARTADRGEGPLAVRLVPEALLTTGDVSDYLRNLLKPPDSLAADLAVEWMDEGAALPAGAEAGRYRLFVLRPGCAPMLSGPVEIGGETPPHLEVPLPKAPETRRVKLLAADTGRLVVGATVIPYFEYGDDQLFVRGRPRVSDAAGEVVLPLLEDSVRGRGRQATWWAEGDGRAAEIEPFTIARADAQTPVEVRMQKTGVVKGKAWNAAGEPAVGREVIWTGKGHSIRTTVGEDGRYRLEGIPPEGGRAFLVLSMATADVRSEDVRLKPGDTQELDFGTPSAAGPLGAIEGTITAGGKPLAGVYVVIDGKGDSRLFAKTDAQGAYRLERVPLEPARIEVFFGNPMVVDDFAARPQEATTLAAGETRHLDFDVPGGAFRVTVVDDETGAPIPGAVALARPENRELGRDRFPGYTYSPGWGDRVGEDGRVFLPAMIPGESHQVVAGADGYAEARLPGQVPGTLDNPAEVTIRLPRR